MARRAKERRQRQELRLLYDDDDERAMLQLADEWDALEQRPKDSHRDPSQNELREHAQAMRVQQRREA